jgi:hypothetical protein
MVMHRELSDQGGGTPSPERCPVCSSDLVEPVYWAQLDVGHWRLDLRCPECEATRTATFDAAAVHAYNILLYEAADAVALQARTLQAEWAAERADDGKRFVEALRAGDILPIDF